MGNAAMDHNAFFRENEENKQSTSNINDGADDLGAETQMGLFAYSKFKEDCSIENASIINSYQVKQDKKEDVLLSNHVTLQESKLQDNSRFISEHRKHKISAAVDEVKSSRQLLDAKSNKDKIISVKKGKDDDKTTKAHECTLVERKSKEPSDDEQRSNNDEKGRPLLKYMLMGMPAQL